MRKTKAEVTSEGEGERSRKGAAAAGGDGGATGGEWKVRDRK
jgi:hypothetical protein